MADIYIKPTPASIGAATAAQGALADTAVQSSPDAYMPSYEARSSASSSDLSAYSEVVVRRWSISSVLFPAIYKKVGSEPSHIMKFQDASGNWWEIDRNAALSPYHAGATGLTDDTTAVQSVLDLVQSSGGVLDGNGPDWPVTKVSIASGNNFFEITGNFKLKGVSNSAQTCVVEITRGNFAISGTITANGQYKTNYAAGFWVHNSSAIQAADLNELIAVGCLVGHRIGDANSGASVTSELTISLPRTYGCPTAMVVEGGNTYITVVGAPCLSADGFGGDSAWNARTKRALINKGAGVTFLGGELIQTGSGLATDHLIEMQPCLFNTDIAWGRVTLIGTVLETGGPLCTITNPDALTGTALANDKAHFLLNGVVGYHSQDNAPFISVVAAFPGDIVVEKSNFWFPGTRTQPNVACAGNLCHVWVDDHGFGNGFKGAIEGTIGGIVHFSKRSIYQVNGLPNANLVAGIQTLKWQTYVASSDHARFQGFYVPSTGVFTVPTGGLRNMRVRAQAYAAGVTGYIVIKDNGTEVARGPFAEAGSVMWEAVNIAAGRAITVDLFISSGSGSPPSASGFLNTLSIEALN